MQTSRIKILPEAFCKTSIAAKTEKIASSGANCVSRDLNETLITVVLKAIDGQIKQRKTKRAIKLSILTMSGPRARHDRPWAA